VDLPQLLLALSPQVNGLLRRHVQVQVADIGFLGVQLETLFHPVTLAARKERVWYENKP